MSFFEKFEYIFSDFDGTISKHDVIHSFIKNFAKGDSSTAERQWANGEISTEECMKIQLGLIVGLKKEIFFEFINSVQIDESFIDFYKIAKEKNKKIIILSDGFDIFIKTVLKKYGVNIPVWANTLEIKEENGYLKFKNFHPNYKQNCKINSGCCKCGVARQYAKDYIYIGDGLSDRCIAKHASLLFAKNSLEIFCKKENVSYFPYKTFQDIINATNKENFNAANDVSINNG